MSADLHALYLRRLEGWPSAVRRHFYDVPGDTASTCFGPGDRGHWAVQTNATAAAALCVLATDPRTDARRAGMSRDEMLGLALRTVHFALSSHHSGGGCATDGQTWGHSWISALALERLMHGLDALGDLLPETDRALLQKVLISECNWLLDHYEVVAGLITHQENRPESNLWNGCVLYRTALMLPDAPRRDAYIEKGTRFLLNGLSVPKDAQSLEIIAGRPLAEWHVGANIFDTMACNHHGYLNVGYMAICLSNIAMLHFGCRANGWDAPEALYHHARELWQLVKTCTFPDGRLWRIGGDSRVRYCYCQDYAIPVWLWARDFLGDDDTLSLEQGWLRQLEMEGDHNADGTFLSARLARLEDVSPLYYARLEGDRAVSLSMGAWWHRRFGPMASRKESESGQPPISILSEWGEEYHGAALVRGDNRLASWTWRAAQPPQGHCLPPQASSMAEWRGNLCPRILGMGILNDAICEPSQMERFPGGFATCGTVRVHTSQSVAEGEAPQDVAHIDLACVALPDDQTMVVLQRARVFGRTGLREVKGLFLQIPNDVFNGMRRTYECSEGGFELPGCPGTPETRDIPGEWLTVDDCMSIVRVYGPALSIYRPGARQITLKSQHSERAGGTLHADEICCGCQVENRFHDANSSLFDLGVVIRAGATAEETVKLNAINADQVQRSNAPDLRGVHVTGANGKRYVVIVNFAETDRVEEITGGHLLDGLSGSVLRRHGNAPIAVTIPPKHVSVLEQPLRP